jgi:L-ascorbate metabolism protein UlaG (beta-lactamase superfamily)
MWKAFIAFVVILILSVSTFVGLGYWLSAPGYQGKPLDNFDGIKFVNQSPQEKSLPTFLRWLVFRTKKPWPKDLDLPNYNYRDPGRSTIQTTFVNHATVLVETPLLTVLTDPIWSKHAGPFGLLGPKRIHEPGLKLSELPKMNVVLISNTQYDHCDIPTLKKLVKLHNPLIIGGLGIKPLLEKHGITRVVELNWWESHDVNGVPITFVPAQYFSRRGFKDLNNTLWGGFVFPTRKGYVYYAGATGWGPHFMEVKDRFDPIALSILPIGSYEPAWYMRPFNITPAQAVDLHLEFESERSVGVKWGTFRLSDEMRFEPIWDLRMAMQDYGVSVNAFQALYPGRSMRQ